MMPPMDGANKSKVADEIDRLEKLYDIGDYKQARVLLKQIKASGDMPHKERSRLERVEQSMQTDKGALVAFGFTLLVLVFLIVKYGI